MAIKPKEFSDDFVWGAAAAAYQVEGAALEDGKGLSVWDTMCRKDGAVKDGQDGTTACDHYHRYREDVALMKEVGLKAYRLSISWPRVQPEGAGAVNRKGLEFYDRLIDELLAAGITPWVTLFHWDYPYELFCRGGWLNPDSPKWFADYTSVIARKLGDRVDRWMTLNEPQCFIGLGHQAGVHAPGIKLGWREVLRAGHHALLAHGRSVQVLRAECAKPGLIGYAPVGVIALPANEEDPKDVDAARRQTFAVREKTFWTSSHWMDPVFLGTYPEESFQTFGDEMPAIGPDDMALISQPVDFQGVNIYNGQEHTMGTDGQPARAERVDGFPETWFHWPVTPSALYWGPKFLYERYKLPVVVTENGLSSHDWVSVDGQVHDPHRIDFTTRYLRELHRAHTDGVPVRGYFHWSIMDNFEWAEGYHQRFGMVYVDYATQERILKDSARWYARIIAGNGAPLFEHEPPAPLYGPHP